VIQTIKDTLFVPIQPAGWPFIGAAAAVTLLLFVLAEPLGWLGFALTAWCTYFFRDPDRLTPVREGLVVSAADGLVRSVADAVPPPELAMGDAALPRISVFMNVFDVHVNRIPADGEVTALAYRPGSFVNASLDKASEDNERQAVRIATADGRELAVAQIAGLIARRIVCNLYDGQKVSAGERFGMIRFGSRVDVYLDDGHVPQVLVGQRAIAGETVLAAVGGRRTARREEQS
jgi:phosphatidylserine decarboxylase